MGGEKEIYWVVWFFHGSLQSELEGQCCSQVKHQYSTQFVQVWCPSCQQTNYVKALKAFMRL